MSKLGRSRLAKRTLKTDDAARAAAMGGDLVSAGELVAGSAGAEQRQLTVDSFVNFAQKMGVGADNPLTTASYGFNPITRIRTLLEWMYRGSWLAGVAVDVIAEDMTRAGVEMRGDIPPDKIEQLEEAAVTLSLWERLCENIKWSRLYGGSIAVMLIDGQAMHTPLRLETIGKGQFKGLQVFDRWMVDPSLNDLVTAQGPELGLPKYYTVVGDAPALPRMKIHHTRCIRMEGIQLPYWQRIQENLWGISVIERMYDRMIAFDSATTGAAQLVYRSYLRTYKIKGLRDLIAAGGPALSGLMAYVDMMRRFQGTEGITLLDDEDTFEVNQRQSFAGLDDIMLSFGEQISGSIQVPLVRLFGQSPKGMNSTGESDLRTYYDGIVKKQKKELHVPVTRVYRALAASEGIKLPNGFAVAFKSLWELKDEEKATIAKTTADAVSTAEESGLISQKTALKELRQSSRITGVFTNISDEEIEAASEELPPTGVEAMELQSELSEPATGKTGEKKAEKATGARGGGKDHAYVKPDSIGAVSAMKAVHDLDIVIENAKGSRREGVDNRNRQFSAILAADYGYIRRTTGEDGDEVDCFIGPHHASPLVLIIHALDVDTKQPDEDKCMLGYMNAEAALYDYSMSYDDGRGQERIGSTELMSMTQFKQWLQESPRAYRFP